MPPSPEGPSLAGGGIQRTQRTQLVRALSKLGICSRGEAARLVAAGEVAVNGEIAWDPAAWVELGRDRIEARGRPAGSARVTEGIPVPGRRPEAEAGKAPGAAGRNYLALHKPPGYVTTRNDELGRKTVHDLLPPGLSGVWVFPVGRLDKDSEGLLLFTDDGAWSDRLTDPAFHVDKVYRVKLDARPREEDLAAFRAGLLLDGSRTLPAGAEADGGSWVRVTLREGRNRQIRRMFHTLGYKVKRLIRVAIGPLELGDLAPGEARFLDAGMVKRLRTAGGRPGKA